MCHNRNIRADVEGSVFNISILCIGNPSSIHFQSIIFHRHHLFFFCIAELPSIVTVEPATGQIRESITLKCLPRGFPVPTIIWKRGEETLDVYGEKYSTQNSGRLLTISNISLSDEGTYTCICRNKLGQYTADIPVTVLGKASISSYILGLFLSGIQT